MFLKSNNLTGQGYCGQSAPEAGAPEIEVTPEMIAAGLTGRRVNTDWRGR
jgi:hypothetical protein